MSNTKQWQCARCGHDVYETHSLNLTECSECPDGRCTQPQIEQLRGQLGAAQAAFDEAVDADIIPGCSDCAAAVEHLRDVHKWPVSSAEESSREALRGMHVAAHSMQVTELHEEIAMMLAPAATPEEQAELDAYAEMIANLPGYSPENDAAYIEWCESQMKLCSAEFLTGPAHDPYSTSCDKGDGHYPHTAHEGDDPFGMGGRVSWRGGGSCAGDPLRQTDVTYTRPQSCGQIHRDDERCFRCANVDATPPSGLE